MRNVLITVSVVALAGCSAVRSESHQDSAAGSRTFAVSGFDSVALQGSDDVRVVRGATTSVVATGSDDVLGKLDIRVEGSTLKVGRKREGWGMSWGHDRGAVVTVTMPMIRTAEIAGSGDMTVDRADGDAFKGAVSGSGAMQLASVAVNNLRLSLSGSGDLAARGTAQTSIISVAGSGDVDASKLASRTVNVSIAGSGDVRAVANDSAKISIVGSGDVTITGTDKCSISKIGSGDARCSR